MPGRVNDQRLTLRDAFLMERLQSTIYLERVNKSRALNPFYRVHSTMPQPAPRQNLAQYNSPEQRTAVNCSINYLLSTTVLLQSVISTSFMRLFQDNDSKQYCKCPNPLTSSTIKQHERRAPRSYLNNLFCYEGRSTKKACFKINKSLWI